MSSEKASPAAWWRRPFAVPSVVLSLVVLVSQVAADERVTLVRDGVTHTIAGTVVVEDQQGGVLLMDGLGTLWDATADQIQQRTTDETPFAWLPAAAVGQRMQVEFPGFRVHDTAHYVIVYNTSPAYAEWCGALYERLYRAFQNYWDRRGFRLHEPPGPLIAVVFADRQSFIDYGQLEMGDAAANVIGYYSLKTNRVVMFDLTGVDRTANGQRINSTAHINRLLSTPNAERTVATIIHEATHQIAFNCGLQTRYADIPLWQTEGIAIYFETPDLQSKQGWRNIGGVNQARLADFRRYLGSRPSDSLSTLLTSNDRFRAARTAADAYAEAWALTYYLLKTRPEAYHQFLQTLSAKRPLLIDTPEERLAEFKRCFSDDLAAFDLEFLRYMKSVR